MAASLPRPPTRPLPPCVPFLPHDDAAAAADPTASAVVALLNDRLEALLRADPDAFWSHLAHDASLRRALDTYLQFRRRPHDHAGDGDARAHPAAAEDALARRVFVVFRRACAPADEPGATVTRDARAAALRDRRILDVPKLVDLCAIYGPDNPAAVALLARDAATLVPNLDRALADAGARLASGLETTADRLAAAAFEDGALDDDARDDALRYFHDVAVSLAALVRAHPPFAEALLRGGAEAEDVEPGRFGDEKNHRRDRKGKAVMVSEDADGSNVNPTLDPSARGIDPRHAAPGALLEAIDRAAHETTPLLSGVGDGGAVVAAAADATTRALDATRRLLSDPPGMDQHLRAGSNLDASAGVSFGSTGSGSGPDPALAAAISRVRAIFPDHGDGFLALALERFGGDPESCAANLLEGNLPPELAKVDTKTPWPPPGVPTPGVPSARAPAPAGSPAPRGVWAAPKPLPPAPPVGGFIRKKGGFGDVDRGMGGYDADAAKRFIADLEYDDEYDDSFDELAEVAKVGAAAGDVSEAGSGGGNNRRGGHDRGGGSYPESSGKGGAPRTFWIADGRVYHAPKEGATAVTARHVQEASAMAAVDAAARAAAVHGLGAGGNKAALAPGAAPFVPPAARGGRGAGGGAGRGGRRARAKQTRKRRAAGDARAQKRTQSHHRKPRQEDAGAEEDGPRRRVDGVPRRVRNTG